MFPTHFTYDAFLQWWGAFFWPFVRIGAMLAIMPVLSARTVPMRIKLLFAVVITAAIAPSIQLDQAIDPFTQAGLVMALIQVGIGLAMGLAFLVMFQAFALAGQILANAMGLGFASLVDPSTGVQSPVISQLYTIIASLLFVAFNGHLLVIQALSYSFQQLPLSAGFLSLATVHDIAWWGSSMFVWGMIIALPTLTALLLANISLGVISRAAPTLNVFSIGFVITILGGLVLLRWFMPLLAEQFEQMMHAALMFIQAYKPGGVNG